MFKLAVLFALVSCAVAAPRPGIVTYSAAAPIAYAAPTVLGAGPLAYTAHAVHAAPVSYAAHATHLAYPSHVAPLAYAGHAVPLAYSTAW